MSEGLHSCLLEALASTPGPRVWVLDEHPRNLSMAQTPPDTQVLSNRFEVASAWAQKLDAHFSDFDFSPWPTASLGALGYRISKEKAVVHQVINEAALRLRSGGRLWLAGAKQEGLRGYFERARKLLGGGTLHRLGKGEFLAELQCTQPVQGPWLDTQAYWELRQLNLDGDLWWTKPGLFGWNKCDQGSAFLVARLDEIWQRLPGPRPRVLDLGCGYGYLARACGLRGAAELVATDNNAAALRACQANLAEMPLPVTVVAADAASEVEGQFDLVVCNPPFHQGFEVQGELTSRFVAAAAAHLHFEGQAAFVVNAFVPLERHARRCFAEVDVFANNGRFKLVRLARPL